jgi:hypothetical protein
MLTVDLAPPVLTRDALLIGKAWNAARWMVPSLHPEWGSEWRSETFMGSQVDLLPQCCRLCGLR